MIGHNSIQILQGWQNGSDGKLVPGSRFKGSSFFRPTGMSVALAEAGAIPDTHLVRELCATARVRRPGDVGNRRPSIHVSF